MNPYVITLDTVDRCCLIIPYKDASINPIDDRQQSIHQSSLFFDNAQSTPSPQYDHPNSTLFVATATTPATPIVHYLTYLPYPQGLNDALRTSRRRAHY